MVDTKVDPEDQGRLPPELVPLSRSLAMVLRHQLYHLPADEECWCPVDDVLRLPECEGWSLDDIDIIVRESFSKSRPRFEMDKRPDGRLWMRATHKHSGGGERPHRRNHGRALPAPSWNSTEPPRGYTGERHAKLPPTANRAPPPVPDDTDSGYPGPAEPASASAKRPPPKPPVSESARTEGGAASDPWEGGSDPWSKSSSRPREVVPPPRPAAKEDCTQPRVVPPRRDRQEAAKVVPPRWRGTEAEAAASEDRPPAKVAPVTQRETAAGKPDVPLPQVAEEGVGPPTASSQAAAATQPQTFFIGEAEEEESVEAENLPTGADTKPQMEDACAAGPVEEKPPVGCSSSGSTIWQQFGLPQEQGGGSWWHCVRKDGQEDYFLESSPAPWAQFAEPGGRQYWWNGDTDEFFYST